jgi:hypothetical protein
MSGSPQGADIAASVVAFGFGPTSAASNCSKVVRLFDNLVGGGKRCRRHGEAERLGGLEVDCKLELLTSAAPAKRGSQPESVIIAPSPSRWDRLPTTKS